MRPPSAIAFLLAALPALAAEPLPYDHYDPVALNEYAAQAVGRDDTETALILLERAARIFPGDARIAANLETLRAWRQGRAPQLPPRPLAPPAAAGRTAVPPEPPALWPQP